MQKTKGFTLIELLIVIVILGILATAILSAINPLEQIRKANDAGKKSDSAELLNALERYYTTFQEYPWAADAPTEESPSGAAWLQTLVDRSEVKPEFATRSSLSSLLVTEGADNLVHVCFDPESTSFSETADKDEQGGAGDTYVCVPE